MITTETGINNKARTTLLSSKRNVKRLEGKIAIITGGSSGIGLATARQFAAEGAYVYVSGRRKKELNEAINLIGDNSTAVQGDVSNLADLDRLYTTVKQQKGQIDVLFANAGIAEYGPLGEITEDHFIKTFDVNVKGTLFTVQKALPLMPDGSSIIMNASVASSKGVPAMSVYSATKAALRSFARSWSAELKGRKIRVNVVSPGMISTPIFKNGLRMNDEQIQEMRVQYEATSPLGRTGTPDEIAKAVLFLASEDSSYITGTELFVDGGWAQI